MMELLSPLKQNKALLQFGLCAIVFIFMAVPFKVMVLVEGFTEVRPVNAVPIVAGLLFGPAGAWGCAVGNLVSDLFGTFSKASVLGFFGNFTAAYIPYKLWYFYKSSEEPNVKSLNNIGLYILISVIASLFTGIIIVCGLDVFFGYWSRELFNIIILNDFLFPVFLGLPVLIVLTCEDNKVRAIKPQRLPRYPVMRNVCLAISVFMAIAIMVMVYMGFIMSANLLMLVCGVFFLITIMGLSIL